MKNTPIFQPSYPGGGIFFACDYDKRFLGCCAEYEEDVCIFGSDEDNLFPASFIPQYYDNVTDNFCED